MNKAIKIILLIILAVVIFLAGEGVAFFYQEPQISAGKIAQATIKELSSKALLQIVVHGQVTDINVDNRSVTINFNGEDFTANIGNQATVVVMGAIKKGNTYVPNPQPAQLQDIKKGNNVNIQLKLSPDGILKGTAVTIFSGSIVPDTLQK